MANRKTNIPVINESASRRLPASFRDAASEHGTELLFVCMPFIVLIIVFAYKNQFSRILYSSEWAMGASILLAQTIVRSIKSALSFHSIRPGALGFILSLIIVLLFVPSLLILALVLVSDPIPLGLAIAQIAFFIIALYVNTIYTTTGQTLQDIK